MSSNHAAMLSNWLRTDNPLANVRWWSNVDVKRRVMLLRRGERDYLPRSETECGIGFWPLDPSANSTIEKAFHIDNLEIVAWWTLKLRAISRTARRCRAVSSPRAAGEG